MHNKDKTIPVGKYLLTPLTKQTESGDYAASVSIRRGAYDRVIRFMPRFSSYARAMRYAMAEGRRMVALNQMG